MSYQAVFFDVDGTLVDSNDLHARAWVEALAEFGYAVPLARVRRLIGMGGEKLVPAATGMRPDDPRVERIGDRRSERFAARWLAGVRPLPGGAELVRALERRGFRIGIASSAKQEELAPLLAIAGIEGEAEVATSASDAARSKPDPDIVAAAIRRLGAPRDEVVMIGDTGYDVEAARRAGIDVIGFRSGGWSDADLAGAIAIYDGPADLLRGLDTSVLAEVARPR